MMTPPRGVVYLVNSPLTKDNEHQIIFSNKDEQQTYFNALIGGSTLDYNYIRHEDKITLSFDYYTCIKYNYLIFQNTQVNGKWFYYFIESFQFENDKVTTLNLKLDVWQTYQFDINYKKSFIERRHLNGDFPNSLSDIPEQGELIQNKSELTEFSGAYFVFCNADVTEEDTTTSSGHDFKIGDYSIPCMVLMYGANQEGRLSLDLQDIANKGYGDRVNNVVYVPCIGNLENLVVNTVNGFPVCTGSNYPDDLLKQTINFDISAINLGVKKLLCYPYAKIIVQDLTTGQTIELAPDKFASTTISFEIQSTISETPYYRIIPLEYKGQAKAYSDSLVVKCNTSLPVANNLYAKYLMNNQDINNLKMIGSGIGIIGSVASGSAMGAISGFESITNTLLQEQQVQKQPNQLSSITDGAMERILFQNGIKISLYVMDSDHIEVANDYWTMFGYPERKLDYPTPYNSLDYQFIKTSNINITGAAPQQYLEEIRDMFNKGITLWKSQFFRNYP